MTMVLKQCGDNLTRANVMKQAASLKGVELPLLLPGIKINTSPTDFYPIQSVQLARFKGETWERSARCCPTRRRASRPHGSAAAGTTGGRTRTGAK